MTQEKSRKSSYVRRKGSGMPASGPGWGGPARGDGKPFTAAGPGRGHTNERKDELREEMLNILIEIATKSNWDMARMQAADKVLDRIEGKPVARNINLEVDELSTLTNEQLRERLAAFSDRAPENTDRATETGNTKQL